MKNATIPEGRTVKACTHVLAKFKKDFYNKSDGNGSETVDDGEAANSSAPGSPVKKTPVKTPRKRKTAGEGKVASAKAKKVKVEEDDTDLLEDCNEEEEQVV
jgi:hypothetical protein